MKISLSTIWDLKLYWHTVPSSHWACLCDHFGIAPFTLCTLKYQAGILRFTHSGGHFGNAPFSGEKSTVLVWAAGLKERKK